MNGATHGGVMQGRKITKLAPKVHGSVRRDELQPLQPTT